MWRWGGKPVTIKVEHYPLPCRITEGGAAVLLTLAAIAAVAFFVGSRIERAREAHSTFHNYKRRVASMRGVRLRETTRAVVGVAALVVLVDVVVHLAA
jgi:hypothetical protein